MNVSTKSGLKFRLFRPLNIGYGTWLVFGVIFLTFFASCKKEIKEQTLNNDEIINATSTETKDKKITFSGMDWYIKEGVNVGPEGNNFSADNVKVDSKGLHLILKKNKNTGKWEGAEVYSKDKFKYGTYQWQIEGRVDKLNENVVLGLFTYSRVEYRDEMDIEFSRWGNPQLPMLNYTVWPKEGYPGDPKKLRWTDPDNFKLNGTASTHRYIRTASKVKFQSLHGFQDGNSQEFSKGTCTKPFISSKSMEVRMNLWLVNHKAPSNGESVEIVIRNFKFIKE